MVHKREKFFASLKRKESKPISKWAALAHLQAHRDSKMFYITRTLHGYDMTPKQIKIAEQYAEEMWKEREQQLIELVKNTPNVVFD